MKRILIVNTSGLGVGGITAHMLNFLEQMRPRLENGQVTVAATGVKSQKILNRFRELGCLIAFLPDRKRRPIAYVIALFRLMRRMKYDVLHVHGNSSTMALELILGKWTGVLIRIAHCHNSRCSHPRMHRLLLPAFRTSYTQALACSVSAGNWIFGPQQFTVLHNAINLDRFSFHSAIRRKYRGKLGVSEETILLGHVGNINQQKNHAFLLRIFNRFQGTNSAALVLIGTGALESELRAQVRSLGLEGKVHFLGEREDVSCWMQAMDGFVFPSRWEGLGMVLIEAQAAGLPVLASDAAPQEVKLTRCFAFLSLELPVEEWCRVLRQLLLSHQQERREQPRAALRDYNIVLEAEKLCRIYGI